jgi:hypothetical protein
MEGSHTRPVFHFDINGTITAYDATEPGTPIENANMVISKSVYGQIDQDGSWRMNSVPDEEVAGSMSFYDYLKSRGVKDYKKQSFRFTAPEQPGESLAVLVDDIAASMKTFLFPSFIHFICIFAKTENAVFLIRTFGQDTEETLKFLLSNPSIKGLFKNISRATSVSKDSIYVGQKGILTYDEFNRFIETIEDRSLILIQENFEYWNNNGRNRDFGKQLLGSPRLCQIFFDDNDCVNIKGEFADHTHFVRVNTMRALFNNDYFIFLTHDRLHNNLCVCCNKITITEKCVTVFVKNVRCLRGTLVLLSVRHVKRFVATLLKWVIFAGFAVFLVLQRI